MSEAIAAPPRRQLRRSVSAWVSRYRELLSTLLVGAGLVTYVVLDGGASRVALLGYILVMASSSLAWDEFRRHRWIQEIKYDSGRSSYVERWEKERNHPSTTPLDGGRTEAFLRLNYYLAATVFCLAALVGMVLVALAVVALLVIAVLAVASLVAVAFDFVYDFQVNLPTYVHFAVDNPVSAWCWQAFSTITGLIS